MTEKDVETFVDRNLRGARFIRSMLRGAVMRGVDVDGLDIDAPWLPDGVLLVNGVDVVPFVEAELNRRLPGRDLRKAKDPAGLRTAWSALQSSWDAALARVATMSAGTVDICVDGEWSFAQTLRHLVLATDAWLGRAVLEAAQPFHPLGLAGTGTDDDDLDMSIFTAGVPTYDEVLQARAGRVAMVSDFLATVTPDGLTVPRKNPWNPQYTESTLSCLHVILEEEWEHLRFALRDLDTISRPLAAG